MNVGIKPAGYQLLSEHQIQTQFFDYVRLLRPRYPILKLVFAIPNAGAGAQRGQAGKMKAEGVEPGVADVFVSIPVYCESTIDHGLYLEFKRKGQKQRPEQVMFMNHVRKQGYRYVVVYTAEEAWGYVRAYLDAHDLPKWE